MGHESFMSYFLYLKGYKCINNCFSLALVLFTILKSLIRISILALFGAFTIRENEITEFWIWWFWFWLLWWLRCFFSYFFCSLETPRYQTLLFEDFYCISNLFFDICPWDLADYGIRLGCQPAKNRNFMQMAIKRWRYTVPLSIAISPMTTGMRRRYKHRTLYLGGNQSTE